MDLNLSKLYIQAIVSAGTMIISAINLKGNIDDIRNFGKEKPE